MMILIPYKKVFHLWKYNHYLYLGIILAYQSIEYLQRQNKDGSIFCHRHISQTLQIHTEQYTIKWAKDVPFLIFEVLKAMYLYLKDLLLRLSLVGCSFIYNREVKTTMKVKEMWRMSFLY